MANASTLMALTSASVQPDIIWIQTVIPVLIRMNAHPWSIHVARDNAQTQKAVTAVSVMMDLLKARMESVSVSIITFFRVAKII